MRQEMRVALSWGLLRIVRPIITVVTKICPLAVLVGTSAPGPPASVSRKIHYVHYALYPI